MDKLQADTIICIQYSIVSLICTVSLIYFIIATNRSAEHSSELLFYKLAIAFAALCSFTDIAFALREFGMISLGICMDYTCEILYSLGSICGAYCWFIYSEKKQCSYVAASRRLITLFAVPFAVMCLFTVTTPIHKLCFAISGSQYVRGVLNVPFTVICSIFILYSGLSSGISSFRKKNHSKTVLLRMLFMYSVFFIIAQLVQVLTGAILPFRSLAAAVIFMFITLRGVCETVSVDALSGINNRFSLDRELDRRLSGEDKFRLMMIDIDDFKRINDTYGHVYGDEAIRYTASAIVRAVPSNYFVARYGGDEFSVVAPFEDESVIAAIEEKIQSELQKIISENNCPFSLSITAGYTERNENLGNIPDIVKAADKVLYDKKRKKKH